MTKSANIPSHGISLVETLVMIAVSAAIAGVVITAMAALFRYDDASAEHVVSQRTLQRVATTLREDIHRATASSWDGAALTLAMPSGADVVYRQAADDWVRTTRDSDEDSNGRTDTRLGLATSFRCECESDATAQGELLRLAWTNQPADATQTGNRTHRELRYELVARVGRAYE